MILIIKIAFFAEQRNFFSGRVIRLALTKKDAQGNPILTPTKGGVATVAGAKTPGSVTASAIPKNAVLIVKKKGNVSILNGTQAISAAVTAASEATKAPEAAAAAADEEAPAAGAEAAATEEQDPLAVETPSEPEAKKMKVEDDEETKAEDEARAEPEKEEEAMDTSESAEPTTTTAAV